MIAPNDRTKTASFRQQRPKTFWPYIIFTLSLVPTYVQSVQSLKTVITLIDQQ